MRANNDLKELVLINDKIVPSKNSPDWKNRNSANGKALPRAPTKGVGSPLETYFPCTY